MGSASAFRSASESGLRFRAGSRRGHGVSTFRALASVLLAPSWGRDMPTALRKLTTIGWREWLALPDFGLGCVQGKIDTSHQTAKIYALDVECLLVDGSPWMRFVVLPLPGDPRTRVEAQAPLVAERAVRGLDGRRDLRPVVRTLLTLGDVTWPVELALCGQETVGYRLLIGREAIDRRFVVDSARSFLAGPPAVN
jgi:hypothetical protein